MTRVIPYRTESNTSITRNRVQKFGIGTVVFCLAIGLVISVSVGSSSGHNQIEVKAEPESRAKPAEIQQCWCTPNHNDSLLAIYSSRDKNPNGLLMDFADKTNQIKLNNEGKVSLEGSCSIMYENDYYFLGHGFLT